MDSTLRELVRLLFAEGLVLSIAGCGAGALLALAVPRLIAALDPAALPRIDGPFVDARWLAFVTVVPVTAGRPFTNADAAGDPSVAVIDRAFARRLRPDGNVVGMRIRWIRNPTDPLEIVGIAGDIRHRGPAEPPRETVYRPAAQYVRSLAPALVKAMSAALYGVGGHDWRAYLAAGAILALSPASRVTSRRAAPAAAIL